MASLELPTHLRKYIVEQDYSRYSPLDQAVWRYVLRQLRAFLTKHAHSSYLEGLQKTGIEVESIPRIEDISDKLEKFGWRALPVSGFIPPAAFMELQSLGILPIASDMRSLEHLSYTPAPDIVHEAAGHAPILVNREFADYLRQYAQVARKAIISRQDLKQYEAIRELSDLKEHPDSTPEQIAIATLHLDEVNRNMGPISEAGELSRMNWWTAEYGLIGSPENPKIFGAGLLSSVGESKWCLSPKVKRLPLTIACIKQSYDITEPQPQLFVTPDFKHLSTVLEEMASGMAFRIGGRDGFEKALVAESITTLQLNSGLQISGQWVEALWDTRDEVENPQRALYVRANGHCQISWKDHELPGQGALDHPAGFSTPLGSFMPFADRCPSTLSDSELLACSLKVGAFCHLKMASGFEIEGRLLAITRQDNALALLTWTECRATYRGKVYYEPGWGKFDQAVGLKVVSVFGGPADSARFGERDDFFAARVPVRAPSVEEQKLYANYQSLRELREKKMTGALLVQNLEPLLSSHQRQFPQDWLLSLEALELVLDRVADAPERSRLSLKIKGDLEKLAAQNRDSADSILEGLALAHQIH